MTGVVLYSYWRSSAAYRVRAALNLKQIDYRIEPVHLVRGGGEHRQTEYLALNPQGLVPLLQDGDRRISQSLAIIEYLEETRPEPALLPADAGGRARVRSLAQIIACDVHPLQNLRVLKYLSEELGVSDEQRIAWHLHWIRVGFEALEARLASDAGTGAFCHGDHPGLADVLLIPQIYNALRFDLDMAPYPTLGRINAACLALDAFRHAAPEAQPDAA
ncbi:MAG: maleylacetoacetate isomerase [Gammaproteobacteria bacterium]|jgi:maleylacetoacetate isomerase